MRFLFGSYKSIFLLGLDTGSGESGLSCLAMALRLASRRVVTVFDGFTRASILESRVYRRNVTAMAVPSSSLPDEIRSEIFVGLESMSCPRRFFCAEQSPRQKPLYLTLILIPTPQR